MIRESQRQSDLLALLLTLTGNKEITGDSALRGDLDFDSMDFVELLSEMEEHFDINIPDSATFATKEDAVVMDILRFLNDHLGPEYPDENGLLTLTDDQFINRYIPETAEDDSYFRQREWSDSREDLVAAVENKCCWTAIDDDNGDYCIVWGNRTVNRLYNIITRKPIEDDTWEVQVPEEVGPRILCEVDWDTTEGNEDGQHPEDPDLPKQVVVRLYSVGMGEMTDADTDTIADYLSSEYGFCVNSFTWRALAEGEEVES